MTPKAKSSPPNDNSSLLRRWVSGNKNNNNNNNKKKKKREELSGKFVNVDDAAFTLEVVLEDNKPLLPLQPKSINSKNSGISTPSSSGEGSGNNRRKVKKYPTKAKQPAHANNSGIAFQLFGRGSPIQPKNSSEISISRLTPKKLSHKPKTKSNSNSSAKSRKKKKDHVVQQTQTRKVIEVNPNPLRTPSPPTTVIPPQEPSASPSDTPLLTSVANFSKPAIKRHSSEKLMYARSVLSRPYFLDLDTPTIPTSAWILHVSPLPTHFDPNDGPHGRWKYTVSIRPKVFHDFSKHSPPGTTVLRSLQDFVWFESALHAEYDGALLIPLLSMAMAQFPNPDEAFHTLSFPIPIQDGACVSSSTSLMTLAKQKISQSTAVSISVSSGHFNNNSLEQGRWDPAVESHQILDRALYASSHPTSGIPRGSEQDQNQQVPGILLQQWLQDILNGTRARGEFYIPSSIEAKTWIQSLGWKPRNKFEQVVVDVTESEAWEIFFYRKSKSSDETLAIYFEDEPKRLAIAQEEISRLVLRGFVPLKKKNQPTSSYKHRFLTNIFMQSDCFAEGGPISTLWQHKTSSPLSLQTLRTPSSSIHQNKSDDTANRYLESIMNQRWLVHQQVGKQIFGKHNLQPRDFFASFQPRIEPFPGSELIETQKYLTFFQREYALQVMYKLRLLTEHELIISAAWKRFAISLSTIYACERDVDKATLTDEETSDLAPVARWSKNELDDALRIYVKHKSDRAVPSLRVLSQAVYTHFIDLSSVDAALISMDLASCKIGEDQGRFAEDMIPTPENVILMQSRLRRVNQSMNIRTARMAWTFFSMEARNADLVNTAAKTLSTRLKMFPLIQAEEDNKETIRNQLEDIVHRILDLIRPRCHSSSGNQSISGFNSTSSRSHSRRLEEEDNDSVAQSVQYDYDENHQLMVKETLSLLRDSGGIFDKNVAEIILRKIGVDYVDEKMDQLSSNIKCVSKLSNNLRQSIVRCNDALNLLDDCYVGSVAPRDGVSVNTQIAQMRLSLLSSMSRLFCGPKVSMMRENQSSRWVTDFRPSKTNLEKLGVDLNDTYGWIHRNDEFSDEECDENMDDELRTEDSAQCGEIALNYIQNVRDRGIQNFISEIRRFLCVYEERILNIESFIYISAVGILAEKHFSKLRTESLQAWEKKTDIITAINVATKKRLDVVVQELEDKLGEFDSSVSHAGVKDAKERHLASKAIKRELEALANDQFMMLKPTCTDRVIEIIRLWAQYDESISDEEITSLRNFIREIEISTRDEEIQTDGGYHLIASFVLQNSKVHSNNKNNSS